MGQHAQLQCMRWRLLVPGPDVLKLDRIFSQFACAAESTGLQLGQRVQESAKKCLLTPPLAPAPRFLRQGDEESERAQRDV